MTTLTSEAGPAKKWTDLLKPGAVAVRRYWRPFLALQLLAFALVLIYYNSERARQVCVILSEIRQAWGVWFVLIASPVAGVILPEIAKAALIRGRKYDRAWVSETAYAMGLFALNGVIVDGIYRLQAVVFGSDAGFTTVLYKVLVDQFIFTPIYGIPYWALMFAWRRNGYRVRPTLGEVSTQWYSAKVVPILLPAWLYWMPMVSLVYVMPGPLQFWLFCLAIAAWSLVMLFLARGESDSASQVG